MCINKPNLGSKVKKTLSILLAVCLLFSQAFYVGAWKSDNGNGTYTNPVLNADYPDCDVCRVGNDFYMVSSSFVSMPGIPICHSKDLVNWEIIGYVYTGLYNTGISYDLSSSYENYGHGSWAPSIKYYKGTFYIGLYEAQGKFTLFSSTKPEGPYAGVQFNTGFHDPGLFFDDDGKAYIVSAANDFMVAELSADYKSVVKNTKVMRVESISGSLLVEGSHVMKRNGYYYVFRTSTPGEAYEYCFRSKSMYGPYEMRVILNGPKIAGGSQIHQGGAVDTSTGEWWFYIFQDGQGIGRRDILVPMQWQNDWPVLGDPSTVKNVSIGGKDYPIGTVPVTFKKPNVGGTFPVTVPGNTDEFNSAKMQMQWEWNHNPNNNMWSLTERPGYLRLKALNTNRLWRAKNTLTQKVEGPDCTGTIELDTTNMKDGDTAGLCIIGIPHGYLGVQKANGVKKFITNINAGETAEGTLSTGDTLSGNTAYIKVSCNLNTNTATFSYSTDNTNFKQLGGSQKLAFDMGTFQGDKIGIFNYTTASSGGYVDVNWFHYNTSAGPNNPYQGVQPKTYSAYSEIAAENFDTESQVRIEPCNDGGHDVCYIDNGDWLRFEKVDFGNGNGSTSFEARVAGANGGTIELRLDGPDGQLAGTCNFAATGGYQTWSTQKWNISKVTGTHQLYLKFTKGGFNFKWFKFYGDAGTSSTPTSTPTPTVKPSSTSTPTSTPTTTAPKNIEDLNGDGVVNMADVILIASAFNSVSGNAAYNVKYDLNKDGAINMGDVIIVALKFNKILS
ncbi:MAG: family 43 glycosylhydrolase [Bacillota bacterium]|nr:family 43 glycosylhydrolase [Bacillota bacterium]